MEQKPLVLVNGVLHLLPDGDTIENAGDMFKSVYDIGGVEADIYDRANHTGTQDVATLTGLGEAALLDIGIIAGTVAAGDHTHFSNGGDMQSLIYDPTGIGLDIYDRDNHFGFQLLATISDAGNAAGLDVGPGQDQVAAGDHDHLNDYMHTSIYDPTGIASDVFNRQNHQGYQNVDTILGLGTAALANIGTGVNDVASGNHPHPDFTPATPVDDGEAGFVPQPNAGEDEFILVGSGEWRSILDLISTSGVELPAGSVPVMIGATASVAGEKGVTPSPQAGDQSRVLTGDARWTSIRDALSDSTIQLDPSTVPQMAGASWNTDGVKGAIPGPLAGDESKVFLGSGVWATVSEALFQSGQTLPLTAIPVMEPATSIAPGVIGLVPAPNAGNQADVLLGDGTWANISDAVANSGANVPVDSIAVMGGASSTGTKGLVPAQGAGDVEKFLTGNGVWLSVGELLTASGEILPSGSVPLMGGATAGADGDQGLVPFQQAGTQNKLLTGGGTWAAVNELLSGAITIEASSLPLMGGAPPSGSGARGAVPEQLAGDADKLLTGAGTWIDPTALLAGITLGIDDVPDMVGTDGLVDGTRGLVPVPPVGAESKALRGDGQWISFPQNLTWQGEWVNTTPYVVNDVIQYDGQVYVNILNVTGGINPDLNTSVWEILVARGSDGLPGAAGAGFDGYVTPNTIRENTNNISRNQLAALAAIEAGVYCGTSIQNAETFADTSGVSTSLVFIHDSYEQRYYVPESALPPIEYVPSLASVQDYDPTIHTYQSKEYNLFATVEAPAIAVIVGFEILCYKSTGTNTNIDMFLNTNGVSQNSPSYDNSVTVDESSLPSTMGWYAVTVPAPISVSVGEEIVFGVHVGSDSAQSVLRLGVVKPQDGNAPHDTRRQSTLSPHDPDASLGFKIIYSSDPGTLTSVITTASEVPSFAYLLVDMESPTALDLGVNLVININRGSGWEAADLVMEMDYGNGRYLVKGEIEFTGADGTNLQWQIIASGGITPAVKNTVFGFGFKGHCADVITERTPGSGVSINSKVIIPTMPTSASGLATGALWNDGGLVRIA